MGDNHKRSEQVVKTHGPQPNLPKQDASNILAEMAETYRERNQVYGDNYKNVGKIMAILFPDGAPAELLHSDHFHLFELMVVKLTRFAISDLSHQDSIHDTAVYAAMIEAILKEESNNG
jgi:hypothetical protein